jgi:hypothetical protein
MTTGRSETVAVIGGAAGIGAATGRRLTERFRVAAEAVAGRIVFALGPEARAFWRVACESGIGTSSSGPSVDLRQAHSTIRAG